MSAFKTIYCFDYQYPAFIQQHKPATKGSSAIYFFASEKKHALTDMFTIAIWTIKMKKEIK